jgi:hypothetical protein
MFAGRAGAAALADQISAADGNPPTLGRWRSFCAAGGSITLILILSNHVTQARIEDGRLCPLLLAAKKILQQARKQQCDPSRDRRRRRADHALYGLLSGAEVGL